VQAIAKSTFQEMRLMDSAGRAKDQVEKKEKEKKVKKTQ